jgi:hypothetical protein
VRRDRKHRGARPLRVVQPLQEVSVPPAATAGAHGEPSGQLSLSRGGEGTRLLVAHVHPPEPVTALDGVHERVEAVADGFIDPFHACLEEDLDQLRGNRILAHGQPPAPWVAVLGTSDHAASAAQARPGSGHLTDT